MEGELMFPCDYSIYPAVGKSYDLRVTRLMDQHKMMQWVSQEKFLEYEKEENNLIPRSKSNRVSIYSFWLPWHGKTIVMKVSEINPRFKRTRKIELFLRRLVKKDYNENAFEGCCTLQAYGIPVANPLAFWAIYKGLKRKNYFLYEKIEKVIDGERLATALQDEQDGDAGRCLDVLLSKIVWNIRDLHEIGWRHGDPEPKNFLFDLSRSDRNFRPEDIRRAKSYIIDFDGCHRARIKIPAIKKFFDLKDLIHVRSLGVPLQDVLKKYQGGTYSSFWYVVLQFWLKGGFRLNHWFKRDWHRAPDSHLRNG